MVRLAHFSDIHLTAAILGWQVRDVVTKRAGGWMNLRLFGRGKRFRDASHVAAVLRNDFATHGYDQLVFSGDATTMGFPTELAEAAQLLGVNDDTMPPGIAVPGNHDVYVHRAARARLFEQTFARWQTGSRVAQETYPFARKVGHVWLIGVNSAKPNRLMWDASGRVGVDQLQRLRELCDTLDSGPRIVVTHYPLLMENYAPEPYWHRLRDWAAARDIAAECGVCLWLHGHRHRWYLLPISPTLPFPTICAGSSTQFLRWGYHDYTITEWNLKGLRRVYDPASGAFIDAERFELELPRTK